MFSSKALLVNNRQFDSVGVVGVVPYESTKFVVSFVTFFHMFIGSHVGRSISKMVKSCPVGLGIIDHKEVKLDERFSVPQGKGNLNRLQKKRRGNHFDWMTLLLPRLLPESILRYTFRMVQSLVFAPILLPMAL